GVVDLVVHVGDVHDESHLEPLVLEEALEQGEDHERARVPDVDAPIHSRAAGVDADPARLARLERANLARQRVVDPDQSARSTLATASAAMPSPRPTKPMPSFVVNLTFTSIGFSPMQRAS